MTLKLAVSKRDATTDVAALREAGSVPAVVYGPKQEPISLAIERVAFEKALQTGGESTIITLEGLAEPLEVLIHDVDFNPAKGGVLHADFYAIERGKELTTNIPLHFIGEAPAEKREGVLNKILHEVEVTCRPSDLPSHIDVDISVLTDFETQIHVKDLLVTRAVTIETDPEEVVAFVAPVAEETESEETPDIADIEVEQKGKKEEAAA